MKIKYLIMMSILISTIGLATASNPYGEIYTYDVYYNDKLLPGEELAKPTLKIGEPFEIKMEMTVYQKSDVYVSLSCMERNSFKIINGPTVRIEEYSKPDILEANSSKEYEWIVQPTERWRGGSLPLDIYYTILAHGDSEPLVNSGFTVAYCTISNEYYEGETPTTSEQPESETQSTKGQQASENSSAPATSAPAFSLVAAILALALVFLKLSRRQAR